MCGPVVWVVAQRSQVLVENRIVCNITISLQYLVHIDESTVVMGTRSYFLMQSLVHVGETVITAGIDACSLLHTGHARGFALQFSVRGLALRLCCPVRGLARLAASQDTVRRSVVCV